MRGVWYGVAATVLLLLLGAGPYVNQARAEGETSDGDILPINRKTLESQSKKKEQRLQVAEAQKAKEEEKQQEKEKKAKLDKLQRKTGRTASSWQVLNR
jgi:hypothetical protein